MPEDPVQQSDSTTQARRISGPGRAKPQSSIFDDKVVRIMAFTAVGLLILFLVTVVSALLTGVLQQTGPRTLMERELTVTARAIDAGTTDATVWGQHISALVATNQFARARAVIADARESVNDSETADITLGEVRLLRAQGEYQQALAVADKAIEQISEHHEAQIAGGGPAGYAAELGGRHENYYTAKLLKAKIYEDMEEWESALEYYTQFIEGFPGAADVLVDRGNIKLRMGDESGAEADFREALRFDPYYPKAHEGLERIGASQ